MVELKYRTESYYYVDYDEFDKFVKEIYGVQQFEVAADLESGNDTSHTFNGIKKKPLSQWDAKKIEDFKTKDGAVSYTTRTLLEDLCNNGHIPEGNYIIRVSW